MMYGVGFRDDINHDQVAKFLTVTHREIHGGLASHGVTQDNWTFQRMLFDKTPQIFRKKFVIEFTAVRRLTVVSLVNQVD